jgi:enoyl-[acyl-carrier protein] reductase I
MADTSGLMKGKRGLIMGVANNRSIAWGIAKACADAGAELALTYQGDALKKRVEPLAADLGAIVAGHCDVTDLDSIDAVFRRNRSEMGQARFRGSRDRILRQGRTDRALRRDPARISTGRWTSRSIR